MSAGIVVGFLNNIFIAAIFGLTRAVDAYYAALVLPLLFMALCIDYLGKNFLPVFTRAKTRGAEAASELASSVITIVSSVALIVSGLIVLFCEPIFAALLPGFSGGDAEVVQTYFMIMSPAIILMVINTFHEYICQSMGRYVAIATSRVVLPAVNLAVILLGHQTLREYCLPISYLLGHIVVFLILAKSAAYRFRPMMRLRDQWEKKIFLNSFALMASGVIARSHSIITSYFASFLGGGALSGIRITGKLVNSVQEATTSGARMVAFARASALHVDEEHDRLGRLYNMLVITVMILLAPIIVFVVFNSETLIRLIFFRGQFTEEMVALVSLILMGLMPSAIFFSVNPILSNAFYAMDSIKVPMFVMPLGAVVYLFFAWLSYSDFGVLGLALSMTTWSGVIFVILLGFLGRKLRKFQSSRVLRKFFLYGAFALVAYGTPVYLIRSRYESDLATLFGSAIAGTVLYWLLLTLSKDVGLSYLYGHIRELLGRRSVDATSP